uniref:Rho GTPase-activating protein 32 n=1 Tax=Sphenodon punctatus TaxID=8508 RepID=A0A8D0G6F1_SPHPU
MQGGPAGARRPPLAAYVFFVSRMMKSSLHAEEDDFVPELQRSIHPRERPDWEETLSAMARGADIPEIPGELPLRTCGRTASMKVKNVKKLSFTKGHFPKMAECAHFHYENVDFGNIQIYSLFCHSKIMGNNLVTVLNQFLPYYMYLNKTASCCVVVLKTFKD